MQSPDSLGRRSILSVAQGYAASDAFAVQTPHPFSTGPEPTISQLRELINSTLQISGSLNAHATLPLSNPKLHSLFRQDTGITHTVHNASQTVRQTISALRKRVGTLYGEDVPLDRDALVHWCTARFQAWGKAAGMETFTEEERDGRITMMLGGKVIVIDVELAVDRSEPLRPTLSLSSVKTSLAVPNGATSTHLSGSPSLDGFLADSFRSFLTEVHKDLELQDAEEAAQIGSRIADDLKYLMKLDHLALHDGESSLKWFNGADLFSLEVEKLATEEALAIIKETGLSPAPLNIFLLRAHALPLPYLLTPSVSFLIYLSPLAYLTVLRTPAEQHSIPPSPFLPNIDISLAELRTYVGAHPRKPGVTRASLILASEGPRSPRQPEDLNMDALAARPTYPLGPPSAEPTITFPSVESISGQSTNFFLDFTDNGKYPGIIMSQTRMREIETIVNPLAGIDEIDNVPMMMFSSGSWVDLLLSPTPSLLSERYVALYTSPTSLHPPLLLRLTGPEEPGFRLERVPIRALKDLWAILEVVREQCWLNETLLSCNWVPEALHPTIADESDPASQEATEDELQAVLGGTVAPKSIPVNVFVPTQPPHDPLFDSDIDALSMSQGLPRGTARIVMASPERPPISGLVEIAVAYDATRPRGIALSINGGMGADLKMEALEEVCLRGGLLGLPGRVWAKAHGLS